MLGSGLFSAQKVLHTPSRTSLLGHREDGDYLVFFLYNYFLIVKELQSENFIIIFSDCKKDYKMGIKNNYI